MAQENTPMTSKTDTGLSAQTAPSNIEPSETAKKARGALSDMNQKVTQKFNDVKERVRNVDLSNLQGRAKEGLKGAQSSVSEFIRNRPMASLGIAVAAGFIVATAFRNRD